LLKFPPFNRFTSSRIPPPPPHTTPAFDRLSFSTFSSFRLFSNPWFSQQLIQEIIIAR
jgi:hypothetical protein